MTSYDDAFRALKRILNAPMEPEWYMPAIRRLLLMHPTLATDLLDPDEGRTSYFCTLTHAVVYTKRLEFLKELMEMGVNPNLMGRADEYSTPISLLYVASVHPGMECVKFLIDHGASFNIKDEGGSLLSQAVMMKNADLFVMVLTACVKDPDFDYADLKACMGQIERDVGFEPWAALSATDQHAYYRMAALVLRNIPIQQFGFHEWYNHYARVAQFREYVFGCQAMVVLVARVELPEDVLRRMHGFMKPLIVSQT